MAVNSSQDTATEGMINTGMASAVSPMVNRLATNATASARRSVSFFLTKPVVALGCPHIIVSA